MGISLYEISQQIIRAELLCTDEETGEFDDERFNELTKDLDLESKALNVAKYIKSLLAEAKALRDEEKKLADRRRSAEGRAFRLKQYLQDNIPEGDEIKDAQVQIKWRKGSQSVETIIPDDELPEQYRTVSYVPNKIELAKALKDGADPIVVGAKLVTGPMSVQIK